MTDVLRTADYTPSILDLSFVKKISAKPLPTTGKYEVNLWAVETPEDYGGACALGRSYAQELTDYMIEAEFPPILGYVMAAMGKIGNFGGVEIGFCQAIAEKLMR